MHLHTGQTSSRIPNPACLPRPHNRRPTAKEVKQSSFAFGVDSERFVAAFLRAGDYTILATRARVGRAEVDLIVHRDDIVAFVEVKARRDLWSGLDAVTPKKMRQLTRAANAWLAANPSYATCSIRFDIALVSKFHELEYLENAFEFQEDDDFVF